MNKEDKDKIIMILFNRYNINPSAGERMLDDIQPVIEQQLLDARDAGYAAAELGIEQQLRDARTDEIEEVNKSLLTEATSEVNVEAVVVPNEVLAGVDEPIRHLVKILNENGYETVASCCGHGKMPGNIALKDGRELFIIANYDNARYIEKLLISTGHYDPINK